MSDTRQEFLHNSGANIFYSEYFPADPQAPTLILLHGNGEDHTYFVKQIPALSPHFRLVLMDTRGQGQSTGGDGGPLVEKELKPELSGIVISAQGGGSAKVQAEISAAMEALFGLPAHKIKVLKRVD